MKIYQTKAKKLTGTNYREVNRKAMNIYKEIKKKTKRRPYIRSAYFSKSKIFLELFWQHLWEKENFRDKIRRLRYFPCALELIQNTRLEPILEKSVDHSHEMFLRFFGKSPEGDIFIVQIKQDKRSGEKWLMSIFPK